MRSPPLPALCLIEPPRVRRYTAAAANGCPGSTVLLNQQIRSRSSPTSRIMPMLSRSLLPVFPFRTSCLNTTAIAGFLGTPIEKRTARGRARRAIDPGREARARGRRGAPPRRGRERVGDEARQPLRRRVARAAAAARVREERGGLPRRSARGAYGTGARDQPGSGGRPSSIQAYFAMAPSGVPASYSATTSRPTSMASCHWFSSQRSM